MTCSHCYGGCDFKSATTTGKRIRERSGADHGLGSLVRSCLTLGGSEQPGQVLSLMARRLSSGVLCTSNCTGKPKLHLCKCRRRDFQTAGTSLPNSVSLRHEEPPGCAGRRGPAERARARGSRTCRPNKSAEGWEQPDSRKLPKLPNFPRFLLCLLDASYFELDGIGQLQLRVPRPRQLSQSPCLCATMRCKGSLRRPAAASRT